MTTGLRLTDVVTAEVIDFRPARLVVAGYTGRDEAAVHEHIAELAAIGIAAPPAVPMFYELDPDLLSTDPTCSVGGLRTSGEVEPVCIRRSGRWYLAVGSDHTDRALEREDIRRAKNACPKPMSRHVLALPSDPVEGGFDPVWDTIGARASVDGVEYQHGTLGALRPPGSLLPLLFTAIGDDGGDLAVYGGTLPLLDGTFVYGSDWRLRLDVGGTALEHRYTTTSIERPEQRGDSS